MWKFILTSYKAGFVKNDSFTYAQKCVMWLDTGFVMHGPSYM